MGGESAQATAERTHAEQSPDPTAHWEQGVVGLSATALVLRELEYDGWTVLHDVRLGKLSVERARSTYGVVLDANGTSVDHEETARLRAQLA